MVRPSAPGLALGSLLAMAACGESPEPGDKGPCSTYEVFGCGKTCSAASPCAPGLFCGADDRCTAECTVQSVAAQCEAGESCSADGRCVRPSRGADAGSDASAPRPRDAGDKADAGFPRDAGGDAPVDAGASCRGRSIALAPVLPNVLFVLDQSASMAETFDGSLTRWDALKGALIDANGLIARLAHLADFGVALYTGDPVAMVCPALSQVAIAPDNLAEIRALYGPALPRKDTPTGDAIEALLGSTELAPALASGRPTAFVLATDGEPDRCEDPDSDEGAPRDAARKESVDALTHAFALGIHSRVVALATVDKLADAHLEALAAAGLGDASARGARVTNLAELAQALSAAVSAEVPCAIPFAAAQDAEAGCALDVAVGGAPVACDAAEGFQVEGTTLVLEGSACASYRTGARLSVAAACTTP